MADTIVAQATTPGVGGLAVIRISGPEAVPMAGRCFRSRHPLEAAASHTILYGSFYNGSQFVDTVTASVFRAPRSYTGEDTVEIGSHGGAVVPSLIISTLIKCGCRMARPGEFTQRAFVNGKLNLLQAEAVADIIHSISMPSAEVSARQMRGLITDKLALLRNNLINAAATLELEMDFAHEDTTLLEPGSLSAIIADGHRLATELISSYQAATTLRDGFVVALCGPPNAGKSTLFNSLLNYERAIVNPMPGTTRDLISELVYFNNMPVKLYDTAGLRPTAEPIEQQGIEYSMKILAEANLILWINDYSKSADGGQLLSDIQKQFEHKPLAIVQNKIDLMPGPPPNENETFYIAANIKDERMRNLTQFVENMATQHANKNADILLNERQFHKINYIKQALETATELLAQNAGAELLAIELREAGQTLDELTGHTWNETVLNSVFSGFCIGK